MPRPDPIERPGESGPDRDPGHAGPGRGAPDRGPDRAGPDQADPGRRPDGTDWHSDELVGLDPDDPEAQEFAAHLARMRRDRPGFTVEGYLDGVSEFADSANRAEGGRRLGAVVLTVLLLIVTAFLIWEAVLFVLRTWF